MTIVTSNSINSQPDFVQYIQDNSIGGRNLSIRGLAGLCGVSDNTQIIRADVFASEKLAQKLAASGFQADVLSKEGFCAQSAWLVIEYFAYESKAKAEGAKRLARLFGSIGVQTCFDMVGSQPRQQQYQALCLPADYISALKALVESEEQKLLQAAQIEILKDAVDRQSEVIDELFDYSSIVRIAKFNDVNPDQFAWIQLKAASKVKGLEVKKAPCAIWGTKNLYSHDAWRLAYPGVQLPETTTLVIKINN